MLRDLPRYLNREPSDDIAALIKEFPSITSDLPGSCNILAHDIQLINPDQKPIKQASYRLHPYKVNIMEKKVQYLLDNKLAEQSISPWASPCILVSKPDGTYRFCTDFRKVNSVTVMDSFPLSLVEELIDRVDRALCRPRYPTSCQPCYPPRTRSSQPTLFQSPGSSTSPLPGFSEATSRSRLARPGRHQPLLTVNTPRLLHFTLVLCLTGKVALPGLLHCFSSGRYCLPVHYCYPMFPLHSC